MEAKLTQVKDFLWFCVAGDSFGTYLVLRWNMIQLRACGILCLFFGLVFSDYGLSQQKNDETVSITTTTGALRGKLVKVSDHEVFAFLGIPFAEPPIGYKRFKKPTAVKPWQGTFDAFTKPIPCMQTKSKEFPWVAKQEPSEDCLFLNIWVPKKLCNLSSSSNNLPIMIWIHGGGYWSGSSALEIHDGAALAAYGNVIVASMNYRVGPFGFLYSGTPDAPGNMGLYDQKLAIEWIRDNAKTFCGDRNNITLFGESSGSVSVGFHLISPLTQNLFKRAIMQSGSPYHPLLAIDPDFVKLKDSSFATALGCANETTNLVTDPETVVDCMRNLDAKHIVQAEAVILKRSPYSFTPIHNDDFIPKSAIEAVNSGDFKHTEILIGNNKDEGTVFLNYIMPEFFTPRAAPDLPLVQARTIIETLFQQNIKPSAKEVADFYLKNLTDDDPKAIQKAIHTSLGDFLFVCPSVLFAEKFSKENAVYYYVFTHRPSQTIWGDWVGVGHFEEVSFIFGAPAKSKSSYTNEECKFSFDLIQQWTSFAQNGKPESTSNEPWPKYSESEHQYNELNPKNSKIGRGPHTEACNFWKNHFS